MAGRPPRNREGEAEVAERLRVRLNADGGTWGALVLHEEPDDPIDASASGASGERLEIQVTRVANEARWMALGRAGRVDEQSECDAVAEELFEAIERKHTHYDRDVKRNMTLAIDTMRLPSHTFSQVMDSLRRRHGEACRALGFRAIWVVGHRDDLVFRVDI